MTVSVYLVCVFVCMCVRGGMCVYVCLHTLDCALGAESYWSSILEHTEVSILKWLTKMV